MTDFFLRVPFTRSSVCSGEKHRDPSFHGKGKGIQRRKRCGKRGGGAKEQNRTGGASDA